MALIPVEALMQLYRYKPHENLIFDFNVLNFIPDAAPVFLNLTERVKAHENLKGRGNLLVIRAKAESRRSKNASVNFLITKGK